MTVIRPFSPTPINLALVRRLAASQLAMDTTTALTRGVNPLETALLTVVPLADLGFPTLVLREDENGYIGQIRHRIHDTHAHLVTLAPAPHCDLSYTPWLELIEGLGLVAARRGAFTLTAEIPENDFAVFEILRKAGFMVYARQTIYQRPPHKITPREATSQRIHVRPLNEIDGLHINLLYSSLVPSLIQRADPMPEPRLGSGSLVVETNGDNRRLGYLEVIEGRCGILVKPLLHPDLFDEAPTIIDQALRFWSKAERLPLYFCVRSYQEWLGIALRSLDMVEMGRQIMFVKHMVVHIKVTDRIPVAVDSVLGSLVPTVETNRGVIYGLSDN